MAMTSALGVSSMSVASLCPRRSVGFVPVSRPAPKLRVAPIVAFRDDKRSAQSSKASGGRAATKAASKQDKKQPLIPTLGKPPTTPRENAESILWFVAIAGFFMTGVLFVTIPAFQVGGNAFTNTWQSGINKSVGIKDAGDTGGRAYARDLALQLHLGQLLPQGQCQLSGHELEKLAKM